MTIITYALILGISTSIDYFLILFLLFSQAKNQVKDAQSILDNYLLVLYSFS